jgi:hypothetical protein
MGEIDGWVNTAIGMYAVMALAIIVYSFVGWVIWEFVIFPLFS